MTSGPLDILASDENFNEAGYLASNPDVAAAVKSGVCASAYEHFHNFGKQEGRLQRDFTRLQQAKSMKLALIRPLLRADMPFIESAMLYDFLTKELREEFNIVDTDAVSSNPYDPCALE